MREAIANLIPELDLIRDEALRERTLDALAEATRRGGWSPDDLSKIPFTLLIANCEVSWLDHTRAVTRAALQGATIANESYRDGSRLDTDVVVSGGLLHDVGKLLEYRREGDKYLKSACGRLLRHPFSGAAVAWAAGLPDEVVHVIAVHAREGDAGYRSPEAVMVHHADFMNFDIFPKS